MKKNSFLKTFIEAVFLTVILSTLFYRSMWGGLIFPLLMYLLYQKRLQTEQEDEKRELEEQFMNGIRVLNTSLQAGLSMENAWKEVQRETELLYGNEAVFYKEVKGASGNSNNFTKGSGVLLFDRGLGLRSLSASAVHQGTPLEGKVLSQCLYYLALFFVD